jgi:hypothetical protein
METLPYYMTEYKFAIIYTYFFHGTYILCCLLTENCNCLPGDFLAYLQLNYGKAAVQMYVSNSMYITVLPALLFLLMDMIRDKADMCIISFYILQNLLVCFLFIGCMCTFHKCSSSGKYQMLCIFH